MEVSVSVRGAIRNHAAKNYGRSYAGALFTRVFLAAARGEWGLLPGLHAVRDGLPV